MKDKVFFDTNLLIYLYSEDNLNKRENILDKISNFYPIISLQVLNEFSNVLLRKFNIKESNIKLSIKEITSHFGIFINNIESLNLALDIKTKLKYSFFDSLIIATSLQSECSILFSEDMQHSQIIENKLKIINPFKYL